MATTTTISSPSLSASAPASPDLNITSFMPVSQTPGATKRYSQLEQYQILVGNVDAPPSPVEANQDLYHELVARERKATRLFWFTGILFFTAVAAQIALCLGIAVGAQMGFSNDSISVLAAINTFIAATIAMLKGLGLPEKKGVERTKLQRLIARIRTTTKKYRIGIEVDANTEANDLRTIYEEAQDAAEVTISNASAGVQAGAAATQSNLKKF